MGKYYTHLTIEERSLIQVSLELGQSPADIARKLNRPRSCISRELRRNGWKDSSIQPRSRGRPSIAGGYRSIGANQRARDKVLQAHTPKRLIAENALWNEVIPLLNGIPSAFLACRNKLFFTLLYAPILWLSKKGWNSLSYCVKNSALTHPL